MSEQQSDYETDQDPHGVVRSVRYEAHGSIPPVAATYADEEPEVVLLEIDHLGIDKELDVSAAKALRACLDQAIAEAEDDNAEEESTSEGSSSPFWGDNFGFPSTPWTAEHPDQNDLAHVWASDGDLVATVCESPPHGETHMDRARLIVTAGTAAHEARKMGYDPVAAVQALPELLRALRDISGNIDTLNRAQMVDLAERALASAEGSDNE